jgi:hypothetical protein
VYSAAWTVGRESTEETGGDEVTRTIKAATIYQPWATLIAKGLKSEETRTSSRHWINMPGRLLAIHAGLARVDNAWQEIAHFDSAVALTVKEQALSWPRGAVLAVARVREVRLVMGDEPDVKEIGKRALCDVRQKICIRLSDVHEFKEPIPERGYQALWNWNVPSDLWAELAKAGLDVSAE